MDTHKEAANMNARTKKCPSCGQAWSKNLWSPLCDTCRQHQRDLIGKTKKDQKHTPGPWHIGEDQDGYKVIHAAKNSELDGAWVAMTRGPEQSHDGLNGEADARLIAAAPDLLVALKKSYEALAMSEKALRPDQAEALEAARAAIARAEGKEAR